jgi:hypothetical protein
LARRGEGNIFRGVAGTGLGDLPDRQRKMCKGALA